MPTHGGSLRIFGRHAEDGAKPKPRASARSRARERTAGLDRMATYAAFEAAGARDQARGAGVPDRRGARGQAGRGLRRARQGQHASSTTAASRPTSSPTPSTATRYKQGRYLPGSRIPIHHPDRLAETRPDVIVILPWNFRDEIAAQLAYTADWGAELVVFVPEVTVLPPARLRASA